MDSGIQKSILQMARGAIQERADYEMSSLLNHPGPQHVCHCGTQADDHPHAQT